MNSFPPRPLGARIPDRLHAVSCSLPTMRDVIGYEEKDPTTVARMTSGYPRFVVHPLSLTIERAWRARFGLGGEALWMVTSPRMGEHVRAALAPATARLLEHDSVWGVAHAEDPELRKRARAVLQHAGGFLSSRAAEDYAARHGLIAAVEAESLLPENAEDNVKRAVARVNGLARADDVLLAPSGMNAFWAVFRALLARGRTTGRDRWLQVGWLYLDTAAILEKFTGGQHLRVFNVHDRATLERIFREHGSRLAAVITETPTNPALQTPDLGFLAQLARQHGAAMIVDPTVASPRNVDVLPHADVVLNSLTKYAASEGDVIGGAVMVTPRCADGPALQTAIAAELEPVYPRDLARLAAQIGGYDRMVDRCSANTRAVVDYLRRRRGVRQLYWCFQDDSRAFYAKIARGADRLAPMVSFEVDAPVAAFYDATPIAKGPSFGMRTSLLCPYVYLAHYDLVTTAAGRELLASAGMTPNLLRLAIGEEPAEELIAALEQGFVAAGW